MKWREPGELMARQYKCVPPETWTRPEPGGTHERISLVQGSLAVSPKAPRQAQSA
jgi:hypothetical protein